MTSYGLSYPLSHAISYAVGNALLGGVRPAWVQPGAIIDEIFTTGQYWPRPITQELVDTRASSKYVTNSAGILVPISSNVLPVSNTGALIEPAATNLVLQSQALATAPWGNNGIPATVTNNAATGPDGTLTATSVTPSQQYGGAAQTISVAASTSYAVSCYMQLVSGNPNISITAHDNGSGTDDIHTFTLTTSWQRFSFVHPTTGTTSLLLITFGQDRNAAGFGTKNVWGADLKQSAIADSYVPTTTTSATRAADSIVIQRTGIGRVVFTFDDNSQQTVSGINTATQYTIPTNLNRPLIKRMTGYAA